MCALFVLSATVYAQTYNESMRYWDEGPLTWEDIPLKPNKDNRTCDLNFRWLAEREKYRPAWNTVEYVVRPRVAMDKSLSWHNLEEKTPQALRFDQLVFDINELYYRRFLTEYLSDENTRSFETLHSFYSDQNTARWIEVMQDTDEGRDSTMLRYHELKVAEDLADASYPSMSKKGNVRLGLTIELGAMANLFTSTPAATFGPAYGFDLGIGFRTKRHEAGMFVFGGGGTLHTDYINGSQTWHKGDSYEHRTVFFAYEYNIIDGTFFNIAPMAGFGGRILDWTEVKKNDNPDSIYEETVAMIGLDTKFKLYREINGDGITEHRIGLKVFGAKDFARDGLNAWSINIGLNYNLGMFTR